MIFDNIKNADLYKGLLPNLDLALQYMQENDLNAMEPGRYPVADGKVLVIIKKGFASKDDAQANWESHRRDIDIQYLLEGDEVIGFCNVNELEVRVPYDEGKDKILYHNEEMKGFKTRLKKGDFLILFPEDAHATCLRPEGLQGGGNKAVIKVAL